METSNTQEKYDALLKLTQDDFQAFLYDCDGTLADNMGAHTETYIRVAAEEGLVLDGAIIDEFAGLPIVNVVEQINTRYQTTLDPEDFKARKYKLFLEEYIDFGNQVYPSKLVSPLPFKDVKGIFFLP